MQSYRNVGKQVERIISGQVGRNSGQTVGKQIGREIEGNVERPVINEKVDDRICGWGPTLSFYLSKDLDLEEHKENIFKCLKLNYGAAYSYLKRFDSVRIFYAEDLEICETDIEKETVPEMYRNMCIRYNNEIDIVTSICPEQPLGLLYLMLDQFKSTALPEPTRLLDIVKLIIPWIGREKVSYLMQNVEEIQVYLLKEPVSTTDYVSYLEYIEASTAKVDKMEEELDYCKELYDIVEEFNISIANDEMVNYLGLSVALGYLRNLVDKKIEETARIIKRFNDQMTKDISGLIAEVGVIKDECMVCCHMLPHDRKKNGV
ncbi:uncharacterized protein LOC115879219 [Sitophilus oryzae]|uniref:Uncharacterized protein LOC115879219 n=1 Tax=Sitophilus oryzae TaxID=7048 RepID=A0A6J2XKG6_SITOR|nr:uncharacterized protein LOC115879219 [Sitophilus oryzae]